MAAYAALVSVMRIMDKLHHHHRPPISLDKTQAELLTEKMSFLMEFLEAYNPHLPYSTQADPLETRIADAAHTAEDVIESHIVDRITNIQNNIISSDGGLYQDLAKVIEDMASIQKEAMDIREKMGLQHQLHMKSTPLDSSRSSSSIAQTRSMVGVEDLFPQMKDKLTCDRRDLQIIPIVGMGGTGKTTFAANIYKDPLIQEHFHICAWVTISQQYSIPEIFTKLLDKEGSSHLSENELGEMLYKYLFGRKYLIIMDDMWNIEAWERVRRFFPNTKNGSRVVITTRLSNLLPGSDRVEMGFLDEESSWELLSRTVFGENGCCPVALEEIGKKIAESCKGLPLSIVVVGGFLAKSGLTSEYWEYIEENLSSIVMNSVEEESCLRILHMSYKQLPLHLKPCFLYMGIFPEDIVIPVSRLCMLWVAEGFLKPKNGKSFEEIAKEYMKELTDRNLILIHKMGNTGSIKKCKIHDLLREMCLREAEKENFYIVSGQHSPPPPPPRRIFIFNTSKNKGVDGLQTQAVSLARSLVWGLGYEERPPAPRLLRILVSDGLPELENMFQLVNLRHLELEGWNARLYSLVYRLWNLESIAFRVSTYSCLPDEIWCMPQIRHLHCIGVRLPDPPQNGGVLPNLVTLREIRSFKCSEELVTRIPNIKKLGISYDHLIDGHCLNNLVCLHKLESLYLSAVNADTGCLQTINFPRSLKKLNLTLNRRSNIGWEGILDSIGGLPFLEKLQLGYGLFEQGKWETNEGQFRNLKCLKLAECCNLKEWITESSHFPSLEHLVLRDLQVLEEIPLEVADIPTLKSIKVVRCRASVAISAKRIVEEQEESNGEALIQVLVRFKKEDKAAVESLASRNIRVQMFLYN